MADTNRGEPEKRAPHFIEQLAESVYAKAVSRAAMAFCAVALPIAWSWGNAWMDRVTNGLDVLNNTLIESDKKYERIEGRVTTIEKEREQNRPFRYTTRDAEKDFRLRDAKDVAQDAVIESLDDRVDRVEFKINRFGQVTRLPGTTVPPEATP